MSFKDAMARKERLTLSQLASYDDILTDVLVDHVSNTTTPTPTFVGSLLQPTPS